MEKEFYTSGELAKLTGVSYKTIRHYNDIGLLAAEEYTNAGYRLYGDKSVRTLQKILMLRYLDFSLEDIKNILLEEDTVDTFSKQEKLLQAKIEHIKQMITAIKEIQKSGKIDRWEKMLDIIHMTQQKEEIINQYKESKNLQKRIDIHAYSTSEINWYKWVLDGLQLKSGMKVLELGCGNGALWASMRNQLPRNIQIYMVDNSKNMLKEAQIKIDEYAEFYKKNNIQFIFLQQDVEKLDFNETELDRIIANHMLYHISNKSRYKLLKRCKMLLKNEGMFYASTVGRDNLKELFSLIREFDDNIEIPNWVTKNFELENGEDQLKQIFSNVFIEKQSNDLMVSNPVAIYEYIYSWPGNVKDILHRRQSEWMEYLKAKVSEETPYFIHKSIGAFKAFKL